ncbi:MAG: multidrug effflux MFS transporter [Rhodobacteraceae bacterium]|nr:multidrug effflux MFS transporter [Paracoccaceae bacterium]
MSSRPAVRFLDRSTPPHIMTLVLLAGLGALSMNIFLPSLPAMAEHFRTDYRLIQLSVALYLGVNAVLQVFIGPVSDRFGRRPVMLAAIGIFLLATLGTLLAPTVELFLAFRALQAVIVAGLVIGRAVVRDMVPQEEAASMIGYVTMGMAVVPMVGPMIGGALEEAFSWQASFVLLFVCGLLTLWLTWADQGETAVHRSASFAEQFRQYPELLASPRFWGYCLTAAFASGAFFAYLGGAPFVGSEVYHLSPAALGFYFGAPALGYAAGNFLSGRYSVRFGINRMVLAGCVLTCAGLAVLLAVELAGPRHPAVFFGFMTFVGLGNGMVLPNATAGMLSVRPRLAGSASGLGGAIMIGGGAALSALAGALLTPGTGPYPLLWLMLATSAASVVSILYVIRRARAKGVA